MNKVDISDINVINGKNNNKRKNINMQTRINE